MKTPGMISIVGLATVLAAPAASLPGSINRSPMLTGSVSDRLSIGVTVEDISRDVKVDGMGVMKFEATAASLCVGVDVLSFATILGSVGGSQVDNGESKATASLGVAAYLWEGDIISPDYASGRVSLRAHTELAYYASSREGVDIEWFDGTLALLFGYEKFDPYPENAAGIDTSLAVYVGPAVSYLDGEAEFGGSRRDIEAEELFGVLGGVDLFISSQCSLGGSIAYFGQATLGASVRYHF